MVLLTICVTLSARYKLPIIREICICISNLNIHMRSLKKIVIISFVINWNIKWLIRCISNNNDNSFFIEEISFSTSKCFC